MTDFKIQLPEQVEYVISTLEENGYEAYAVGGCVRDSCLGRIPGDWDVTTSAKPEEVKKVFRHTVDTGIEHGTVTVLVYAPDGTFGAYEVTTYRVDGEYIDGRHPSRVEFTPSLTEDLKRRDFTFNAMAYSPKNGLVDLFGGMADLGRGLIRCVGNADERFDEDALRILRAVRFSAQLGFDIEDSTAASIVKKAVNLGKISRERVYTEINKLICSSRHERIVGVRALGLSPYIARGFDEMRPAEVSLPGIPLDRRYLRYAVLFRTADPETARTFLKQLKADNETIRGTVTIAPMILAQIPADRYTLKCVLGTMGPRYFEDLLDLREELGMETDRFRKIYEKIKADREPVFLKDLAIGGADLIKAGMEPGPQVKETLERLLDLVRKYPDKNNREDLLHGEL